MFNIFIQIDKKESLYKERSQQDNFYSKGSYNNEFQFCRICGRYNRFEYDRCSICKSN